MNKHVQIRNIPPDLHRRLKVSAAARGQTLSDYLRGELEKLAKLPTLPEWVELIRKQNPIDISREEIVDSIRDGRKENDEKLERWLDRPMR